MADIRGITLSNSAALRLQVRDVERALSALARLMRWPRIRPPATGRPRSPWALPLAAFREAQESAERLQVWARETLGDLSPDFSRLRQLLALLPDVVQTTTPEILRRQRQCQTPQARLWIMPFRHGQRMCRLSTRHPVYPSHTMLNRGQFAIVMMRWSACGAFVAGLRAVNPAARPSHCYAS